MSRRAIAVIAVLGVGGWQMAVHLPLHTSAAGSTAFHSGVDAAHTAAAPLHIEVGDEGIRAADGVVTHGVHEILDRVAPSIVGDLSGYTIRVDVIPASATLTALPDFTQLQGRMTFDGRSYSSLRAVGPSVSGDHIVYAVGEEEVVPGESAAYGSGFALAHETGHLVREYGLDSDQSSELRDIYRNHHAANGPWLTDYASSNDDEYFADCTAAFFEHPWSPESADRFTPKWLQENDPLMFGFLSEVYSA